MELNPSPTLADKKHIAVRPPPRYALQHLGWKLLLIISTVIFFAPILTLLIGLQHFSPSLFEGISASLIPLYLRNTVLVLIVVIPLTLIVASSLAWLCSIYQFPGKKLLIFLQITPLFIPSFVSAISWKESFGGRGLIQQLVIFLFPSAPSIVVPNFFLLCLILTLRIYPYLFFVLNSLFSHISQSLIDTARLYNTNKRSLFLTLGLPQAWISIVSIGIFIIMELLNEYWIYQYFGYDIISSGIVRIWQLYGNLELAKILVLGIALFSFFLLRAKLSYEYKRNRDSINLVRPLHPHPLPSSHGFVAILLCLLPPVLGFLFPITQQAFWAIRNVLQGNSVLPFITSSANSIIVVLSSLVLLLPLALLLCYAVRIWNRHIAIIMFTVLSLGYCIPNASVGVLSIGAIDFLDSFFPTLSLFSLLINRSIIALVLACIFRYLPLAMVTISSGFHHQNIRYEQAARSLGRGPLQTLLQVCIPVNMPYIISALLITTADIIMDIPITLMLHPFNFRTLALDVYFLIQDEMLYQASIPSLLLVFCVSLLVFTMYSILSKRRTQFSL